MQRYHTGAFLPLSAWAVSLALVTGCASDSGGGTEDVTGPDTGPDTGPGTGQLIVHVEEFLGSLVGRDLEDRELEHVYALEHLGGPKLFRLPLAPSSYAYRPIPAGGEELSLVVHDGVAYWHDQATFYWWPVSGGDIESVSVGSYIIQNVPLPAPPYIYFDEFITDRLYRIRMAGGTPEEVDVFPLGGNRGLARDANNLYWIGATDGSYLKTQPVSGGALLSGAAFLPHKLKAVPAEGGTTTLYWLDTATNGNPVVRKFPVTAMISSSCVSDRQAGHPPFTSSERSAAALVRRSSPADGAPEAARSRGSAPWRPEWAARSGRRDRCR